MADEATRQLRVWRGDAAGGGLTDYTVPVYEGEVVLDVLHRLQATQAGDLAIRWNCKAGKCGSCSAEINGRAKLLCMTRLSSLPPGPITITPLRTYPVIRDLVTDVGIKITDNAIIPMKERSADQRYDPLGRVVHSWRRRKGRTPAG
jgi:succinate dehydrogenase / fumarate reductase iron-sulfur subunit